MLRFLLSVTLSFFFIAFTFSVECRLEGDGEIIYGDFSEFMCNHFGGINMDELGFPLNPDYSGSIEESRYRFTEQELMDAWDSPPKAKDPNQQIVQCKITEGDEVVVGALSRFMCKHLGG